MVLATSPIGPGAWAIFRAGTGTILLVRTTALCAGPGLSVDHPAARFNRRFSGYGVVLAPGLMHMADALKTALATSGAQVLLGPRSAARDGDFAIPVPLPPALPGLDATVARVESLRPDCPVPLAGGGAVTGYLEALEGGAEVVLRTEAGAPVAMRAGTLTYMGGWGDAAALDRLVADLCARAGVETETMPGSLRRRDTGTERFWFNYGPEPVEIEGETLPPAGVLRRPHQ